MMAFWAGIFVTGGLVMGALMVLISGVINAWAVGMLWGWFATPVFGIATPTAVQCYGLVLLSRLFTHQWTPDQSKDASRNRAIHIFSLPLVVVLLGYVAHRFFA